MNEYKQFFRNPNIISQNTVPRPYTSIDIRARFTHIRKKTAIEGKQKNLKKKTRRQEKKLVSSERPN